MQSLLATVQPLAMQHGVDVTQADVCEAIALLPCRAKAVGVVAAAVEARAMAGGERSGLVEEEQFGPAASAHHLAPAPPEFADAYEPRLRSPALVQQGFGRGIMDDAAIAREKAALRRRDDVARGSHAVLQRHWNAIVTCRHSGMVR